MVPFEFELTSFYCSTFTPGLSTATQIAGLCSHKNSHSGAKKAITINSIAQNYQALNFARWPDKKKGKERKKEREHSAGGRLCCPFI